MRRFRNRDQSEPSLSDESPGEGRESPSRDVESLYREAAPRLRRRLRGGGASADEAGELVQDAFARLLGSGAFQRLQKPEAFLNRILRNLQIDASRRRAARPPHVPFDEDVAVRPDQADGLELEQTRSRYRSLVDSLPPRTREVFLLHRVEGLSYNAIAARLAISARTVEWHIGEALLRISRGLEA